LALAGCQVETTRTPKVLPEWSRGQQLGFAALNQPVHIVSEGDRVHAIWVAAETNALQYVRLNAAGQADVDQQLAVPTSHPSNVQLLLNADGSLCALWTDNPGFPRAIFVARLDPRGELLTAPTQISPAGAQVADFEAKTGQSGQHYVFWADEIPSAGGLHYLRLDGNGTLEEPDRLLVARGESPTASIAADGMLHLGWVVEPESRISDVYYGVFDPAKGHLNRQTRVASYKTATGLVSYPPSISLDETTVYLFWSLEQRGGGLGPGEARSYYVAFPLSQPGQADPIEIVIPSAARPAYTSVKGELPYQHLASTEAGWPTLVLYMPSALPSQGAETGVFFIGEVATQRQSSRQVVWAIYRDGQPVGYQLPTDADGSLRPTAAVDEDGNVHLVWLVAAGFGRYQVFYASTSTAARMALDQVSLQDRVLAVLDLLWNLAPALGFFPPVFLLWTFASLVWIILFYFIKVEGGLDRRPAQIALVVSIVLYLCSKIFLLPAPLFYAPFQDRLPANLQFIPVLGTPIVTLLLALAAIAVYQRRRDHSSLLAVYLIFVVTDALLSLVIYVPRWLAG